MNADPAARAHADPLASWRPGATRSAILGFLDAASERPVDERVAVFDNDGTLWCERPRYAQLEFLLGELRRAADADPSLGARAEYRALLAGDTEAQADLGLPAIAAALVELCAGIDPHEFDRRVAAFVESARHPDTGRPLRDLRYLPMLELLAELRHRQFSVFLVTGGGVEFVRAISGGFYGVAPEAVVGSTVGYDVGRDAAGRPVLRRTRELFGPVVEGEAKVAQIQFQLGRRPILAAGNSPGDTDMLDYAMAAEGPSLALLVDHDDADREYRYVGRAGSFDSEGSLPDIGRARGWTVASMRDDWGEVFATASAPSPWHRSVG